MSTNDAPSAGGGGFAGRPPRSDSVGNEGEAQSSSSQPPQQPQPQQAERSGSMSHASVFDRPPPSSVSAADRGLSSATALSVNMAPASDLYSSWLGESASTGVGVGVGVGIGMGGGHMSLSGLDLGPPSASSASGAPPTHRRSGSNASSTSGRGSGGMGTGAAWASVGVGMPPPPTTATGISAAPLSGTSTGTGGHRRSSSDTDGTSFAKPGSLLGTNRSSSVPSAPPSSSTSAAAGDMMNDPKAVTSIIHDAARITNWTRVHSLSLSHPASARYSGPDRWTALHHCCSRRCPHAYVVEALFRAYPAALLCLDEKQWTPLHHAARFKAPRDVVQLLLKDHPDMGRTAASKRCSKGRSPLFYAIRYDAPDGVVELLLEANPEAVLEPDRDGVTPLALVWDRYVTSFEGRRAIQPYVAKLHAFLDAHAKKSEEMGDGESEGEEVKLDGNITIGNSKLRGKWEKANMLLRAAFGFPLAEEKGKEESGARQQEEEDEVEDEDEVDEWEQVSVPQDAPSDAAAAESKRRKRKWRILHAASTIRCHPTLFQLACVMHPEQAAELDENDLYYNENDDDVAAVGSATGGEESEQTKKRVTTALHLAAASPAHGKDGKTILTTLLAMNASAAGVVDGITGSLPLHIAVENDRKVHWIYDGIVALFEANPAAIEAKDWRGRTPLHRACSAIGHRPATGIMVAVVPGSSAPQGDNSAADNDGTANTATDGTGTNATAEPTATAVTATTAPQGVTAAGLGSIIQNLVTIYVEAASIADISGRLPLHVIAKYGEGWTDDAESVLKANPGAAQVRAGRSRQGAAHARLPIHIAAAGPDAGPDLISRLVAAHPRGVSLPDGFGKLPLHLACESGKIWEEGVRVLYESYPRAVEEKEDNGRGWTALHMAASCPHSARSLIEALVDIYPAATFEVDRRGQYPLHLACSSGKSWEEGIEIIFDANPEAAGAPNSLGMLPFHCAALAYSVFPSVEFASSSKIAPTRSHSSASSSSDDSIVTTHHEHEPANISEVVQREDSQDLLAKINVVYCLLREVPAVL